MSAEKELQKISLIGNQNAKVVETNFKGDLSSSMQNDSQPNQKHERGKAFRQILAAFVANIGPMNTGLIFGFSAVAIPQLFMDTSAIKIDEDQASWIASLSSLSTPIGCIMGGFLSDKIGRKKTLILTEIPLIIGWIIIAMATRVEMIYTGRLLCGIGSGIVGAPARVYTSEVTQPHLRGMLTALSSVALSFGVLFQYTLGAFMSWQTLSAASCVIPIAALIGMCCLPETPNYLISKHKHDKALKSLSKLRGSTYNVHKEVHQLQEHAKKSNSKKKPSSREILQALTAPSCLKPFFILFVYFMLYQFSGVNTITFYAVEIFKDSGANMDKNTATIILGALRFLFTIVGCIALRRSGRRPMSFISGVGCAVTMIGLGTYMYYKSLWMSEGIEPLYTWIPVACIFTFMITCTLGYLIVPWVMIGELYPMKVRGIMGGLTTCSAHCCVFIVVKTYPLLKHLLEIHGVFIVYGCLSVLATIFFYYFLPETKGKTLHEIEDYFSGHTSTLSTIKPNKITNILNDKNNMNNINNNNNNNDHIMVSMEDEKILNEKQ